jgi:hydrogenase-4 component E
MVVQLIDTLLVIVLLMNFYVLASTQVRAVVYVVAAQGVLLGLIYPLAHQGMALSGGEPEGGPLDLARVLLLAAVMVAVKGTVIPRLLLKAISEADIRRRVESAIGIVPGLLVGAIGTWLVLGFAARLPLRAEHGSLLIVPASLATVLTGFVVLVTRWRALTQVLGYIVLENGIFIFGLLLVQAIPILVELGVLLDLFVCVFVMGIIINHVSRQFGSASTEQLTALRE